MWMYVPIAAITLAYALYWYFTRTFDYWEKKNVVHPKPWPLFGNTAEIALLKKFIGTTIKEIYHQYPNEKIVGLYRMTVPYLLIRDLDIIKHILIKDFDMFADRGMEFSEEGLGTNLFTTTVDSWRVLRSKFSPLFTSGKLKNMLPLITERADKYIQDIEKNADQTPEVDVQALSRNYTMSSIAACAFGLDLDFDDPQMDILNKLDHMTFDANYFIEFVFMSPYLMKKFNSIFFSPEVTSFFFDIVKTVFTQRNHKPSSRNDFMDLILEMKQQKVIRSNKTVDESEISVELTDGMIAAQAFVFYVAGFETSSTTLGFMLYELALNPSVQDKLIDEIDNCVRSTDGRTEYDAVMDMPYMTKVFDETLRKYPIVDPIQRAAQVDYKIPGTNVTINKGQLVYVSVAGIHSDDKHYLNPEVFDPERFALDKVGERHSCAYLPFGNGPRNCIGMRFAKVQTRIFLLKLLSKYRVQACKRTPETLSSNPKRLILGPDQPIVMNLVRRTDK